MSDSLPDAENAAGCACDPEDAALAEVRWLDAAERLRVTCALCGSTRILPPGQDQPR